MTSQRQKLFIGSSKEGLDVAYGLQEALEFDFDSTVWTQDIFSPSRNAMESLERHARTTDLAVLVFTPDDVGIVRGIESPTPRDNVVFELGLFMGAIGRDRCFYLVPRTAESLKLPSDLLGMEALGYMADRGDGNLFAALGPAANRIRRAARSFDGLSGAPVRAPSPPSSPTLQDYLDIWNGPDLASARARLREPMPAHSTDEDEDENATKQFRRVYGFLDGLSDAVLGGVIDESAARTHFGSAVQAVWRHAYTFLGALNQADEGWDPMPKIAALAAKWR